MFFLKKIFRFFPFFSLYFEYLRLYTCLFITILFVLIFILFLVFPFFLHFFLEKNIIFYFLYLGIFITLHLVYLIIPFFLFLSLFFCNFFILFLKNYYTKTKMKCYFRVAICNIVLFYTSLLTTHIYDFYFIL